MDQVLDLPRSITAVYLKEEKQLLKTDEFKEAEIRHNLKYYENQRLLRMKYQKELDEHLAKTGNKQQKQSELIKRLMLKKIANG